VCSAGYEHITITGSVETAIRHYWVDTYADLLEKHRRYLEHEGRALHESGHRFAWSNLVIDTARALMSSLIKYRGILGGFDGIFLSFFFTWYTLMSRISLRRYERHCETSPKDGR
jgi:hypothetical protein